MPVPNSPLSDMEQDRLYQNVDDYREQAELLLAKVFPWCGRNRVNASGFSRKMLALHERIDHFSRLVADERVFYNLASKSLLENISRLEEFNGAVDKLISGPTTGLPHQEWVQLRERIQVELEEIKQLRKSSASEPLPGNPKRRRCDIRGVLRLIYMRNYNTHKTQPRDPRRDRLAS